MLCEQFLPYRVVSLEEDHSFRLPVTQQELGDALGLSTVHTNRVIQELWGVSQPLNWPGQAFTLVEVWCLWPRRSCAP